MQNGDDIIVVVMLKFRQILVVSYLFHPANLENDIFNGSFLIPFGKSPKNYVGNQTVFSYLVIVSVAIVSYSASRKEMYKYDFFMIFFSLQNVQEKSPQSYKTKDEC